MRRCTLPLIVLIFTVSISIVPIGGTFVQLFAQTSAPAKRPFTFADLMSLKRIGSPAISPDGKWVLFSAMDVDLSENKKTTHLWVVPLAGGDARQLPSTPAGETGGHWGPDGEKYLFVSARDGSSQVWVSDFDSAAGTAVGSPKKITSISTEADGAIWSPDGKNIVFVSEVYPDCGDDACNKAKDEAHAKSE